MDIDAPQALSPNTLPFARCYQLDALEKALMQNTIVYMGTGSGKTLIAVMLLRSYAHLLRKPSPFFAVFLVPQVVLVSQQADVVKMHTDLKVGMYWGEMGVDFWDAATWEKEIKQHEVLVMTPQILLDGLRHSFLKLDRIRVLIMDECHHAGGKHPYACIMTTLAFKLLGQPSSSSCAERNWSTYAFIHSMKRNRLTQSRAQDLVFIHNNLHLLSRNSDEYGDDKTKMWDVGGDSFDSFGDVGFLEFTNLSLDEPKFEDELIND